MPMKFFGLQRTKPTPRKSRREENDWGFGSNFAVSGKRLLNKNGTLNIHRRGYISINIYQDLVEASWVRFFTFITLYFLLANLLFGTLQYLNGTDYLHGTNQEDGLPKFAEAFFYSIYTFTTVGYGNIYPQGWVANTVASLTALSGLMYLAIATGLMFVRISRPRGSIIFSKHALITPLEDGLKMWQMRIVNVRNHKILNLEAYVTMTWIQEVDGLKRRQFTLLDLERKSISMFPLNWNIVHVIDANSPLYEVTVQDLQDRQVEFLVHIEGYDEIYAHTIHANSSYTWKEVIENYRFKPMYFAHDHEPIELRLDYIDYVEATQEVTGQ